MCIKQNYTTSRQGVPDISKILYLSIKRLLDNKIVNVILMFQIFITLLAINITIGRIQYIDYIEHITRDSGLTKALYFVPSSHKYTVNPPRDNTGFLPDKKLSEFDCIQTIWKIKYATSKLANMDRLFNTYMYNDDMIKNVKLPLSKGKWFDSYKSYDMSEIPIILSYSLSGCYTVGDRLKIEIAAGDSVIHSLNTRVIGFMNKANYFLSIGGGGDNLSINNIFAKEDYFAIMPQSILSKDKTLTSFDQFARILFLKDGLEPDKKVVGALKNELSKIGYADTIENMISNYKKGDEKQINLQILLWILILILTVTGIGGNNVLMLIKQEKEYAVYFLTGITWGKCILITLLRCIYIFILPFAISFSVLQYLYGTSFGSFLIINNSNIFYSIGIVLLIYVISSVDIMVHLYKTSPMQIIRRWL